MVCGMVCRVVTPSSRRVILSCLPARLICFWTFFRKKNIMLVTLLTFQSVQRLVEKRTSSKHLIHVRHVADIQVQRHRTNILDKSVTLPTFQLLRGWSKKSIQQINLLFKYQGPKIKNKKIQCQAKCGFRRRRFRRRRFRRRRVCSGEKARSTSLWLEFEHLEQQQQQQFVFVVVARQS